MIRVAFFLLIVGLIALGITWIADRPGEVAITWLNWRIETSLMVMLAILLLVIAASIALWSVLRGMWRSPARMAAAMRRRKEERAQRAIARGLIAVGAGDARAAQRHADEVRKLAPNEPLALLLGAQTAQLAGDRALAERTFREMTQHEPTRLLGLRGLFIEAQRRSDIADARLYAEEAVRIAPSLPWAGQAVLQLRSATGDFAGALEMLERNRASGALDRNTFKRQRAVLLTAHAQALADSDRDTSRALALEAVKHSPTLVPAVSLSARFLAEGGELRKAARMIERAWQAAPHPTLAETYAYLRFGDSARDRLTRIRKLAGLAPHHLESSLALARAAIDAREFSEARRALSSFIARPTQRVALLMADLEQAETANEGRSREWTARAVHALRDAAWTAEGFVSDRWLPISPVSGRIDAFEWKAPVAEIASEPPAVDDKAPPETKAVVEAVRLEAPAIEAARVPEPTPRPQPVQPSAVPVQIAPAPRPRPPAPMAETIIPITHAPDDPGPNPDQEPEPAPESGAAAKNWKRMFS